MSISSKILPALALAVVLSPLAAQAHSNPQPAQVTPSSATIDNPTAIYSGGTAAMFPASTGG